MKKAVIYSTSRNVMQSNMFSKDVYILRLVPANNFSISDALMGWCSSLDTENQIAIAFDTLKEACDFASKECYDYLVIPKNEIVKDKKSYSFNIMKNRNLYYY